VSSPQQGLPSGQACVRRRTWPEAPFGLPALLTALYRHTPQGHRVVAHDLKDSAVLVTRLVFEQQVQSKLPPGGGSECDQKITPVFGKPLVHKAYALRLYGHHAISSRQHNTHLRPQYVQHQITCGLWLLKHLAKVGVVRR